MASRDAAVASRGSDEVVPIRMPESPISLSSISPQSVGEHCLVHEMHDLPSLSRHVRCATEQPYSILPRFRSSRSEVAISSTHMESLVPSACGSSHRRHVDLSALRLDSVWTKTAIAASSMILYARKPIPDLALTINARRT